MYEIREGLKKVNDVLVDTYERDVVRGGAALEVEAGTTGFCGGDRKEGGRAYVRIRAVLADFFAAVSRNGDGKKDGIVIAACGDDEILALVEALHFAEKALIEGCGVEEE